MKTIKMTVELMVNDKADTILGIAGYSPEAINSDLLEKIMREVKGMGERLSKGYEEKSCPCCQCNGCDCEEDEEEELIEEEEDEEDGIICSECGSEMKGYIIDTDFSIYHCPVCDRMEAIK